ncbi:MAG TPA: thiamine phosphate synthase [archaeon]|nr:thiamine phosphate synthase [archaeon]
MKKKASFLGQFHIHTVTGLPFLDQPDFMRKAGEVAAGRLAAINLRAHHLQGRQFYELARSLGELADSGKVPLIINDRLDVALAVGAGTLHLGRHSIPLAHAARLCRERGLEWGYSCHSFEECIRAEKHGAAYIYLGTIFPSKSKPGADSAGVEFLRQVCRKIKIPVFAIGGVNPSNVRMIAEAGAFGVAAISAVWEAQDPGKAVEELNRAFESL